MQTTLTKQLLLALGTAALLTACGGGSNDTTAAPAEPVALILSPAVYEACVRFAFGDPNEKSMNLAQAKRLMRDGVSDAAIIAHVRAGGQPVTV